MPLDPRPSPAGNVVIGTRRAETATEDLGVHRPSMRFAIVLGRGERVPAGMPADAERWVPHWATCARRPRRKGERPCATPGCGRLVGKGYLFCGSHWRLVPPPLRATITDLVAALRRGELRRREYQNARAAAIACVLEAEARRGPTQYALDLGEGRHAS